MCVNVLCVGKAVTPDAKAALKVAVIYKDLDGKASVLRVNDFNLSDYTSAEEEDAQTAPAEGSELQQLLQAGGDGFVVIVQVVPDLFPALRLCGRLRHPYRELLLYRLAAGAHLPCRGDGAGERYRFSPHRLCGGRAYGGGSTVGSCPDPAGDRKAVFGGKPHVYGGGHPGKKALVSARPLKKQSYYNL